MLKHASHPDIRPRRLRRLPFLRQLVSETTLTSADLIAPFFIQETLSEPTPIPSMPGVYRYSLEGLLKQAELCQQLHIPAIALFPVIPKEQKSLLAEEAYNPHGFIQRAIRLVKQHFPDLGLITDVALDPYTLHGHDGIIDETGRVMNDATVAILTKQALAQADSGVDIVAPSDMMDGRIGAIRGGLEAAGFHDTCILSYAVKYASTFYGPFREAVGSAPALGGRDKKHYQMDPANTNEALREVALDLQEGADIVMVKPGMPYLDVLWRVKEAFQVPTFAYQVSGEYTMLQAAVLQGWLSTGCIEEALLSLKRGGADAIFTYFATTIAKQLHPNYN